MYRNIILLALIAGIFFTGCSKDTMAEQLKSANSGFTSSIYTVKPDKELSVRNLTINEEQIPKIKAVRETILLFNNKIHGDPIPKQTQKDGAKEDPEYDDEYEDDEYEDDEYEEYEYEEEYEDEYEDDEYDDRYGEQLDTEDINWDSSTSILKNYKYDKGENTWMYSANLSGYWLLPSAYRYTAKQMKELLAELEKSGITDLTAPFDDFSSKIKKIDPSAFSRRNGTWDYDGISFVRQGIEFTLSASVVEGGDKIYGLMPQVSAASVVLDPDYENIIKTQIRDGFYVGCVNAGGYLERINLISSFSEWNNPYNKVVDIYFKEGKAEQIEIVLNKNMFCQTDSDDAPVFTTNERETIVNMIALLNQDRPAAENFIDGYRPEKEKTGTIGSCGWTGQKKDGNYVLVIRKS